MAVIGITLNDVFRDFLGQLDYICKKYGQEISEKKYGFNELYKKYGFKNRGDYNEFIYSEHSFEIFSAAEPCVDGIGPSFNAFNLDIEDDEEHEIVLLSRNASKSIPATLFFLSKLGIQTNNIKFVKEYEDKWNGVDIMITANPIVLNKKPNGRTTIKINTVYNKDIKSDYSVDSLVEFINSKELRKEILDI